MTKMTSDRLSNSLLTVLTSATLAILGFIWHLNTAVVDVQARDMERDNKIGNVQMTVDKMRASEQEDRETAIRLATKLDELTYWIENKKPSR